MNVSPKRFGSRGSSAISEKPGWRRIVSTATIAAFVLGILFVVVFNTALSWTNQESFCISCHEMQENNYREYQNTIHYTNRSGVRAVCADCHVPKEFLPKMIRKIKAVNEVWHKILGSIDTPEKFDAKRPELAQNEWRRMKANDSQECRNCHDAKSFDFSVQGYRSANQHQDGLLTQGQTCIDCHKGIAHRLPQISQGIGAIGKDGISRDIFHPKPPEKETPAETSTPETTPEETP